MTQTHQQHRPPLLNRRETYTAVTDAAYTAKAGDQVIGVNRAGAVTITLPTAEARPGRIYTVKDESGDASTNNITVDTEGSETIDGSATHVLSTDYQAVDYYSDGTNWFIVPVLAAGGGGSGALSYEGGNTTEATTTSTSAVDLMTVSSLTIAVTNPFMFTYCFRKTTGAADDCGLGLKVNSTVTVEAAAAFGYMGRMDAFNQAQEGSAHCVVAPRVTNYLAVGTGTAITNNPGAGSIIAQFIRPGRDADFPNAQITALIIRGISDNASNTLGVDEMHVHVLATS